jgi:hypothetical protein
MKRILDTFFTTPWGVWMILAVCVLSSCRSVLGIQDNASPLAAKIKYDLQVGTEQHTLSGNLLLLPNQTLTLTFAVPILGIEAGRLSVQADSFFLQDRIHHLYVHEPLDSLTQLSGRPLSLPDIQAFFLQEGRHALVSSASLNVPIAGKNMGATLVLNPTKVSKKAARTATGSEVSSKYERVPLYRVLKAIQILLSQP